MPLILDGSRDMWVESGRDRFIPGRVRSMSGGFNVARIIDAALKSLYACSPWLVRPD